MNRLLIIGTVVTVMVWMGSASVGHSGLFASADSLYVNSAALTSAPSQWLARIEKICRCCFYDPVRNWHCVSMLAKEQYSER